MQDFVPLSVAVFDDNSEDDTYLLKNKYPTVSWEFSKRTRGYLFARNKFMREMDAMYFCSLDDDAWFLDPGALGEAVDFMERNKHVAVTAFDILTPVNSQKKEVLQPFEVCDFIGCGHVIRASAIKRAGYYQEMPGFYGAEEKDLSLKLIDLGFHIYKLPGIHVWHDKTMIARDTGKQHRSGVCNDLVFFYRRSPLLLLAPGLIVKLMKHLKFGFTHSIWREAVKGIQDFISLIITMKIKRLPVKLSSLARYRSLPNA